MTAQSGQSSTAGKALAQAATRIAAGSSDLAALLRERQDTADRLDVLNDRLAGAALETGAASEQTVARLRTNIAEARSRLAALDRDLDARFPDFRELTNPRPLSREALQALLRDDEALVMTFTDESFFYVWAISKTKADWYRHEIQSSEITTRVQALRAQLSVTANNRGGLSLKQQDRGDVQPFDRTLSFQIYTDLFAPLEHVFGDARHVMMVLDGPLTSLPPAILVTEAPQGADDSAAALRSTAWLLRRHALTTLPSVSALKALRRAGAAEAVDRADVPFVGFGNPLLGYSLMAAAETGTTQQVVTRGVYEDVTRVADLSPLPNTESELRALARTMGADDSALYLASAATERNVKEADLSRARILAFATHGLLADGLPGLEEPALVFTPPDQPSPVDDALLTATEAAQLNLSASLVILSACDTAGSDGTPGSEGLSGLARAFIYAGARAILVSHWPVDDYAARVLTTGMLSRMQGADALDRAEALRRSTLAILDDTSEARFAHPRIWAPFVVVGEGASDAG
ncbi:CHAT domain-containing protein [Oceanicola sp. 22II-s10i]|uniref:CHAT domain-containing protein n=1 Tax=Oceanicola sp. 22II-s10i TaxID=1317116 RepID=UPI0015962626|nr:CHAT domain-containing protein [Oceanicola sp. 22II-s10i]